MKTCLLFLTMAIALHPASAFSQGKPVIVIQPFTTATGVQLPYDLKQMQAQLVAELKVTLAKDFDIAADAPASPSARSTHSKERLLIGARVMPRNASSLAWDRAERRRTFGTKSPMGLANPPLNRRTRCGRISTRREPVRSAR